MVFLHANSLCRAVPAVGNKDPSDIQDAEPLKWDPELGTPKEVGFQISDIFWGEAFIRGRHLFWSKYTSTAFNRREPKFEGRHLLEETLFGYSRDIEIFSYIIKKMVMRMRILVHFDYFYNYLHKYTKNIFLLIDNIIKYVKVLPIS